MISLLKVKHNFFMQFVALLIFILLIPVGIYSQPREIIFDGTGTLTRDIVKAKLAAENLQLNEEWNATIRGYTEIGEYAFTPPEISGVIQLLKNIVSVTIENGCETIGTKAFAELPFLTTVNIQSNLKVIESNAFLYDSMLANIVLPETITAIKYQAFSRCVSLNLSKLPDSLTTLDVAAFGNCKNISISEIPKGVDSILGYCFQYCENITEITLHENIKYIGTSDFYKCKNLKTIKCLADFVPVINQMSFTGDIPPDRILYVKKDMKDAFLAPNGPCAPYASCWTNKAYGGFTANNILELPDRIEVIISANDANLGNIEIETSADMDNLQVDDILELTAIPNGAGCHRFICWKNETTGEIISKYKAITYVVNTATELVAVFE